MDDKTAGGGDDRRPQFFRPWETQNTQDDDNKTQNEDSNSQQNPGRDSLPNMALGNQRGQPLNAQIQGSQPVNVPATSSQGAVAANNSTSGLNPQQPGSASFNGFTPSTVMPPQILTQSMLLSYYYIHHQNGSSTAHQQSNHNAIIPSGSTSNGSSDGSGGSPHNRDQCGASGDPQQGSGISQNSGMGLLNPSAIGSVPHVPQSGSASSLWPNVSLSSSDQGSMMAGTFRPPFPMMSNVPAPQQAPFLGSQSSGAPNQDLNPYGFATAPPRFPNLFSGSMQASSMGAPFFYPIPNPIGFPNDPNASMFITSQKKKSYNYPPHTVEVLNAWYEAHENHPYVKDEAELEQLARKADISPAQVLKWLSNKRNRLNNTKQRKREQASGDEGMGKSRSNDKAGKDDESEDDANKGKKNKASDDLEQGKGSKKPKKEDDENKNA